MNKRMKDLAFRAGFIGESFNPIFGTCQETAIKNLIELVAEECADLCSNLDGGENMFSRGIREHFGVE
jgi:hypothetical protein